MVPWRDMLLRCGYPSSLCRRTVKTWFSCKRSSCSGRPKAYRRFKCDDGALFCCCRDGSWAVPPRLLRPSRNLAQLLGSSNLGYIEGGAGLPVREPKLAGPGYDLLRPAPNPIIAAQAIASNSRCFPVLTVKLTSVSLGSPCREWGARLVPRERAKVGQPPVGHVWYRSGQNPRWRLVWLRPYILYRQGRNNGQTLRVNEIFWPSSALAEELSAGTGFGWGWAAPCQRWIVSRLEQRIGSGVPTGSGSCQRKPSSCRPQLSLSHRRGCAFYASRRLLLPSCAEPKVARCLPQFSADFRVVASACETESYVSCSPKQACRPVLQGIRVDIVRVMSSGETLWEVL